VAAGRGEAKGASAPSGTVQGAAFGGAKIWNSEICPLLAIEFVI